VSLCWYTNRPHSPFKTHCTNTEVLSRPQQRPHFWEAGDTTEGPRDTHHFLDGFTVSQQWLLGQQGQHQPLNTVRVQLHAHEAHAGPCWAQHGVAAVCGGAVVLRAWPVGATRAVWRHVVLRIPGGTLLSTVTCPRTQASPLPWGQARQRLQVAGHSGERGCAAGTGEVCVVP
jgi:hypothetical protein